MGQSVHKLIESFVESLASEKGYSNNTCRAYFRDLKEFINILSEAWFSDDGHSPESILNPEDIDGLMIRLSGRFIQAK